MTLVVGRISKGTVSIVSDTMLSNELTRAPIPVTKGIIKTKIIAPDVAVSFAGNTHIAALAVRALSNTMSVFEIAEALLGFHRSAAPENTAEFLIAGLAPHPRLIEVRNGQISEGENGWLGSGNAYRSFRGWELGELAGDAAIPGYQDLSPAASFSGMRAAMKHVIADGAIEDVGGFAIAVASGNDGFTYMGYSDVFFPPMTLPSGTHALPFGSAEQGGYAFDVFSTGDQQGVSSYFLQGHFGILYWPIDGGFPEPRVMMGLDPFEFMDRAEKTTGTTISTVFADVRILTRRGFDKLASDDLAGAEADASRALSLSKNTEGWVLQGQIKLAHGDEAGAQADFKKAVQKTPSDVNGWHKFGVSLIHSGDDDGAMSALTRAIEVDPTYWAPFANRANIFWRRGNIEAALSDIMQASSLVPTDALLWKKAAAANQRLGRMRDAYEAARTALNLDPGDAEMQDFVAEYDNRQV